MPLFARFGTPLLALCLSLLTVACGGGGGGGTSISLSPTQLSFSAANDAFEPITQNVTASFVGDGVVVGYAPGVPQPSWLSVEALSNTNTQAVFALRAFAGGMAAGTYTTSVRFITGRQDGSQIKTADLPVTFTVSAAFQLSPASDAVLLREGAAAAVRSFTVAGSNGWTATSDQPWLRVARTGNRADVTYDPAGLVPGTYNGVVTVRDQASGRTRDYRASLTIEEAEFAPTPASATYSIPEGGTDQTGSVRIDGPASWEATASSFITLQASSGARGEVLNYTVSATGRPAGTYAGEIRLRSPEGREYSYPVTLTVTPFDLALTPATLSYVVDAETTEAGLTRELLVADTGNSADGRPGITWTADPPQVSWVQLTPATGSTRPRAAVAVRLVAAELDKLAAGVHSTEVPVRYRRPNGESVSKVLTVSVDLRLPQFLSGMPYLTEPGGGGSVVLGGSGFSRLSGPIRVGSVSVSDYQVQGEVQVRLTLPALAAGRHRVTVPNALGLSRSKAEFVSVTPVSYAAAVIPTDGRYPDADFDRERQRIYLSNVGGNRVEVYGFAAGSWTAGTPVAATAPFGVRLAPSGGELLIGARNGLLQVPLDTEPLAASRLAQPGDAFCGARYGWLGVFNTLTVLLPHRLDNCSGYSSLDQYDLAIGSRSTVSSFGYYEGFVSASADGSRAVIGTNGISPTQPLDAISPVDGLRRYSATANLRALSLSTDGSRVLVNDNQLYDRDFRLLGQLPSSPAVLSPDGLTAYALSNDATSLDVFDVRFAATGGSYAPTRSILLPGSPGPAGNGTSGLRIANFGQLVLVLGDQNLLLVPVR